MRNAEGILSNVKRRFAVVAELIHSAHEASQFGVEAICNVRSHGLAMMK